MAVGIRVALFPDVIFRINGSFVCLYWCLTSLSITFQSFWDGATASWVLTIYPHFALFSMETEIVWNWPPKLLPIGVTMSKKVTNTNINENLCLDWFYSLLAIDGVLLSDFHHANNAFKWSLWVEINTEILKIVVLLVHKHYIYQKRCLKPYSNTFSQFNHSCQTRLCQLNARNYGTKEGNRSE